MIALIAAALLQIAVIASNGKATPSANAANPTTKTTDGGAGNWDDGN